MGNLVSHSADKPDNRTAPTSTAELPMETDNDAAPALGARHNQEHEPAARHNYKKGMTRDNAVTGTIKRKKNQNYVRRELEFYQSENL